MTNTTTTDVCNSPSTQSSIVVESSPRDYDEENLQESFKEALNGIERGCMPFGAVLADSNGLVVARAHNTVPAIGKRGGSTSHDCTRHAEITLLRTTEFLELSSESRSRSTLYSSTEPCVMCAGAIFWSGVGRVVYGCTALELEERVSGPGGFDVPIRELYGMARCSSATKKRIEICGPILEEEALRIHRESGVWKK
mmetsp:Transcript_20122/g.41713  ORF Transcript_20122/g.41713 Transcript_20122/m.41713 type:complete len:197 (+) Transcript_20122:399-989(+)